jgi:hypothetical protein
VSILGQNAAPGFDYSDFGEGVGMPAWGEIRLDAHLAQIVIL